MEVGWHFVCFCGLLRLPHYVMPCSVLLFTLPAAVMAAHMTMLLLLVLVGVHGRFSRYPAILARPVEALESQLSGLAELLGTDLQRASRLAFKVPALAASSNEELQGHLDLLSRVSHMETCQGEGAMPLH
jgi:hypothetical protein